MIKLGSQGQEVKNWQIFLNSQNYNCGTPDGIFGANTDFATKNFQNTSKLAPDGIVGPQTLAAAAKLGYGQSTAPSTTNADDVDPGLIDVVIDVSWHQGTINFQQVKTSGIQGVIIKATEGIGYTDPNYVTNKAGAIQAGLNVGAYHFGTASDVNGQVRDFIAAANPIKGELLVLDWENNPGGTTMSAQQAQAFVTQVHQQLGKYPILYSGTSWLKQHQADLGVLTQCQLWIANYNQQLTMPPGWTDYLFWQYTDKGQVSGIDTDVDRNKYQGTSRELDTFWKNW